jgi:muramoyltetrapeptide carboxypeptidase
MGTHNMRLTKPQRLRRGEIIGIVAPAWSFNQEQFLEGVEVLKEMGFRVKYEQSIFNEYWSMAGHDEKRAEQINRMFADADIKAILCANAGYGSIRTIPFLKRRLIQDNPKIFVGYSDITVLLAYLQHIGKMVVFHGPVVAGEMTKDMNQITTAFFLNAVTNSLPIGEVKFSSIRRLHSGKATGVLVGGNLSMIISSISTPYEIEMRNRVLFLEEIGESLEVIDNHLMQLKIAGKLRHIRGLIIGRMLNVEDYAGKKHSINDVINDIFNDIHVPILYNFPAGHRKNSEFNITLPLGINVTVNADDVSVIFHGSGVN